MTKSSCCFWKCNRNSGHRFLCHGLPNILGRLSLTYLHLQSGADEVSGESWQLITAIHGEDDGLTLSEQPSEGYDHVVLLPSIVVEFLHNLIDIFFSTCLD